MTMGCFDRHLHISLFGSSDFQIHSGIEREKVVLNNSCQSTLLTLSGISVSLMTRILTQIIIHKVHIQDFRFYKGLSYKYLYLNSIPYKLLYQFYK